MKKIYFFVDKDKVDWGKMVYSATDVINSVNNGVPEICTTSLYSFRFTELTRHGYKIYICYKGEKHLVSDHMDGVFAIRRFLKDFSNEYTTTKES